MDGDVHEYEIDSFPKNTFIMIHKLDPDCVENTVEMGVVISFRQGPILNHHRVIETTSMRVRSDERGKWTIYNYI